MAKRLSNDQLTKLCRKWQARLRLQDWDVTVRWAKPAEMMGPDVDGECHVLAQNREAHILLCETATSGPEYVLVHELGHLHLQPLSTAKNSVEVEQALHGFVHALTEGK